MAESELYRKGAALRRQLLGDAAVERSAREIYSDPVMKKFIDLATETVFGALWTRPGLDLKTRALVCVVSDAATGREPELGLHLSMALRQGWTEVEQHLGQLIFGPPLAQRHAQMQPQLGFAPGGNVGDDANKGPGLQIEARPCPERAEHRLGC